MKKLLLVRLHGSRSIVLISALFLKPWPTSNRFKTLAIKNNLHLWDFLQRWNYSQVLLIRTFGGSLVLTSTQRNPCVKLCFREESILILGSAYGSHRHPTNAVSLFGWSYTINAGLQITWHSEATLILDAAPVVTRRTMYAHILTSSCIRLHILLLVGPK